MRQNHLPLEGKRLPETYMGVPAEDLLELLHRMTHGEGWEGVPMHEGITANEIVREYRLTPIFNENLKE